MQSSPNTRGAQNLVARSLERYIFTGPRVLCGSILIELASCHQSGAQNFEVVSLIFEKFAHPCPTPAL